MTKTKEEKETTEIDLNAPATITEGQLRGILDELKALKQGSKFERPKRVTDRVATIRYHEGSPVVWYGNVRELKDAATGKMIAYMDIKTVADDEAKTVEYLAFLNSSNSVQVQIKKQEAEQIIESQGRYTAHNPNEHFDKKWQNREVDLEVISYRYTATIEVLEGDDKGSEYEISVEALNR